MPYLRAIFILMVLAGCIPYSEYPLTAPGEQEIDREVCGSWYYKDEKNYGYIHMGVNKESHRLDIIVAEFDKTGNMEISEYSGHTALLAGNRYFNIKEIRPNRKPTYFFVKYRAEKDFLVVSLMDVNAVEIAIKKEGLEGEISKGQYLSSVRITADKKKLQQFIKDHDKTLFKKEAKFHRARVE